MSEQSETGRDGVQAPFHLIIAEADDLTALQVAAQLKQIAPIAFVTPNELFMATLWHHDPFGDNRVQLASGLEITDSAVLSIFNRIRHVTPLQFSGSSIANQIYAAEEFFALTISWLASFGVKVVNPPHPGHIGGYRTLSPLEDRLNLRETTSGTDPGFATASRSGLLKPGGTRHGYPLKENLTSPGYPLSQDFTKGENSVLIVGADASLPDLDQILMRDIQYTMIRRNLILARVHFAGTALTSIDPMPEAESEDEVQLIANFLETLLTRIMAA